VIPTGAYAAAVSLPATTRAASDRFATMLSRCQPNADETAWNTSAGTMPASVVKPSIPVATATTTKTIQTVPTATRVKPAILMRKLISTSLLYAPTTRIMSQIPRAPKAP